MIGMLIPKAIYCIYIFCLWWIYPVFQTSTALFKIAGLKIKKLFAETSICLSFTDFYAAKTAEVINSFTISSSNIFGGRTLSV